jgi:hypothetical protein
LVNQPSQDHDSSSTLDLGNLVEAVVRAVLVAHESRELDKALLIRDELNRLPNSLVTEVLNGVILQLVKVDPSLCRWFVLDVFLYEADPEGKASVAEQFNLMIADLQS